MDRGAEQAGEGVSDRKRRPTLEAVGVEIKQRPATIGLMLSLLAACGWLGGQVLSIDERMRKHADQAVLHHETKAEPHPHLVDLATEIRSLRLDAQRTSKTLRDILAAAKDACEADTRRLRRRRR